MQLNQLKFGHLNHKTYTQEHSGNAYIQPIYLFNCTNRIVLHPKTGCSFYTNTDAHLNKEENYHEQETTKSIQFKTSLTHLKT